MIDIGDGSPPRPCWLCDASREGAQLLVTDAASLPNRFVLALSADGAARRQCRVIWRRDPQVGVEFVKERKKPARAPMPRSFPEPATPAPPTDPREPDHVDPIDLATLPPR